MYYFSFLVFAILNFKEFILIIKVYFVNKLWQSYGFFFCGTSIIHLAIEANNLSLEKDFILKQKTKNKITRICNFFSTTSMMQGSIDPSWLWIRTRNSAHTQYNEVFSCNSNTTQAIVLLRETCTLRHFEFYSIETMESNNIKLTINEQSRT